jgi:hypothetical protein
MELKTVIITYKCTRMSIPKSREPVGTSSASVPAFHETPLHSHRDQSRDWRKRSGIAGFGIPGLQSLVITDRNFHSKDRFISAPKFHGFFLISDVIEKPGFGKSYRLVRSSDGKPLRHLVSSSRLRLYTAGKRDHFYERYPKLPDKQMSDTPVCTDANVTPAIDQSQPQVTDKPSYSQVTQGHNYEPALKISKQRKRNGGKEYFVLFADKARSCCDRVTPAFLKAFILNLERLRIKRRRRKRNR